MKIHTFLHLFLLFILTGFVTKSFSQYADIILHNGKIFTADDAKPFVTAIAINGNKIIATGNDAIIKKFASPKTKLVNLGGKTVVPGFNDQHDHAAFDPSPVPLKYNYHEFNWDGPTKIMVLDSIASLLPKAKPGAWLAGMIGTIVLSDTSMRRSLDSIAPNNPVSLQAWWGHGIVTNQKGLEAAGLSDNLQNPVGGWYQRNSEKKISTVHENAQIPFWWAISEAYPKEVIEGMEAYGKKQLEGGITSTLFFGTGFSYPLVKNLLTKASIPQRLRIVAWLRSTPEGRLISEWPQVVTHPTSMSTVSGIKYLVNHYGLLNYPEDTLKEILKEALITKRQLMMHIAGDSTFSIVLNLIKETGTAKQWRPLRVRIEHNMIGNPTKEQRKSLQDYGILIMHTPKHNHGSPLRSLLDDKIIVGIAPDGTSNPFFELSVITSRQSNPAENITVRQAVTAFTKTNAYAEFKEKEKGMLAKGMMADLAVLSQDIFTVPLNEIISTKCVLVMIGGKIVYSN